jgi:hypothetical protein
MGDGLSERGASRRRRRLRGERRGSLAADARVPPPTASWSRAFLDGVRSRRAGDALVVLFRCWKWNSTHCKRLKHHLGGGVGSSEQGRRREQWCRWRPRRGHDRRQLLRWTGARAEIKRGKFFAPVVSKTPIFVANFVAVAS